MNPTHNLHYVYLLRSLQNKSLYIGCTSDLKKRLVEHNDKKSYHMSKYALWKLIYWETYTNKADAYGREKSLKLHAQGLRRLKERLRETLSV